MRPKKRDKSAQEELKPQFEQVQADHELFLQAFEKPTQIYRYLRTRNQISPVFLHRTLSYMKYRCTRKRNTRVGFCVDSILEKVEAKHKKELQEFSWAQCPLCTYKSDFMNLTFDGFFDKELENTDSVLVEASLLKMCHKKRKDVSSPLTQVSLGNVKVPCNPDLSSPSKVEALAVASENFNHTNGHAVRSYMLLIRITIGQKGSPRHGNGAKEPITTLCNGHLEGDEPMAKKRKWNRSSSSGVEESSLNGELQEKLYGAELVVYDKHRRCQLTDGDYEVALHDLTAKVNSKRQATWETVLDGKTVGPFEVFNNCPTIKFRLKWSKSQVNGEDGSIRTAKADRCISDYHHHVIKKPIAVKAPACDRRARDVSSPRRRRIFYQFLYNNNTRQQTEARDDLTCPWCSLKCLKLYCLLKHLRTCHARFNFSYIEHPKGARIDVSINDCFDGSYVGNPQDLHSHIGFSFSRTGPVRRTPVTHLIVYRPKKPSYELSEFMEAESESHSSRQFIQGHSRLYYHAVTHQPIRPEEIDVDNEAATDPEWLRQKTINLLDEFTDVNEGEKEIMKMWNLHVMNHNYIGDCQMPKACSTFLDVYGDTIVENNLTGNLTLHMVNLYDFGLIKPDLVFKTMMRIYRLRDRLESEGRIVVPSRLSNFQQPSTDKEPQEAVQKKGDPCADVDVKQEKVHDPS